MTRVPFLISSLSFPHKWHENCLIHRTFYKFHSGLQLINCDSTENVDFFCEVPAAVIKAVGEFLRQLLTTGKKEK